MEATRWCMALDMRWRSIADTSLEYDRTTKQQIYAVADIPVYWILNVPARTIEVSSSPAKSEGRYRQRTDFHVGDLIPWTSPQAGRWKSV